jgi:hypothetical protein
MRPIMLMDSMVRAISSAGLTLTTPLHSSEGMRLGRDSEHPCSMSQGFRQTHQPPPGISLGAAIAPPPSGALTTTIMDA